MNDLPHFYLFKELLVVPHRRFDSAADYAGNAFARLEALLFAGCAALAAMLPDVPKIMLRTDMFHGLLFAPLLGSLLALLVRPFFRRISVIRSSVALSAAVAVGHLVMDMLDNGLQIFAPFTNREIGFYLFTNGGDWLLGLIVLGCVLSGVLFVPKQRQMAGCGTYYRCGCHWRKGLFEGRGDGADCFELRLS